MNDCRRETIFQLVQLVRFSEKVNPREKVIESTSSDVFQNEFLFIWLRHFVVVGVIG